jgi:chromate transport protein ChrA
MGWREIAGSLFKLGATSYGGPAIMGIMQAELQERRRWVSKERFVEGLAVANMLPGATATQLGIFLGYARGGWWGGLVGGLCFVTPAFVIMLALTMAYASLGLTPIARGALYGLGPVVLALFAVAVYPLGRDGDLPHQCRRLRHQDQEQSRKLRVSRPVSLGQFVLAHARLAVDQGDSPPLRVGVHPATEPPGHPQHVLLVEGRIRAREAPPPVAKSTPRLPERKVAIEHDAIRTVVSALQQVLVVVRKIIILFHAPDHARSRSWLPAAHPPGRASSPKRRLGKSVA